MSFQQTLRHRFPGAMEQHEFVSLSTAALHRAGFTPENTLNIVATCRDELSRSLPELLTATWGSPFELSSLAGMLTGGHSALRAALSHRPVLDDRSHAVVYALTHVGIDDDGTIGTLRRERVPDPTTTCGSLGGLGRAIRDGQLREALDPDDLEQSRVEQRIKAVIGDDRTERDLAALAELALQCLEDDLGRAFATITGNRDEQRPLGLDGALITGIQIHGPDERTYVCPSIARIEVAGEARPAFDDATGPGTTG